MLIGSNGVAEPDEVGARRDRGNGGEERLANAGMDGEESAVGVKKWAAAVAQTGRKVGLEGGTAGAER